MLVNCLYREIRFVFGSVDASSEAGSHNIVSPPHLPTSNRHGGWSFVLCVEDLTVLASIYWKLFADFQCSSFRFTVK